MRRRLTDCDLLLLQMTWASLVLFDTVIVANWTNLLILDSINLSKSHIRSHAIHAHSY